MTTALYSLCAAASGTCAVLLLGVLWTHRQRATRLVKWTCGCFVGFAVSNGLAFVERVVPTSADLATARAATACVGVSLLLIALIWESE